MLHSIGVCVCVCVPQNTNVDDRREKRQTDTPHLPQLTSSRRVKRSLSRTSAVHTDTREPVPIATSSGLRTSDAESSRYMYVMWKVYVQKLLEQPGFAQPKARKFLSFFSGSKFYSLLNPEHLAF